jgi:hypothetical protein
LGLINYGNNIGVDSSEIYECIALPLGHFGWLNPLTKVFLTIFGTSAILLPKKCGKSIEVITGV